MKYISKIVLFVFAGLYAHHVLAQTTPLDDFAPGPHIFFEARNIKRINDPAGPNLTFDLYMSASATYVEQVAENPDWAFQSCDVAFDVDFGTDGTVLSSSVQSIANEATVTSNQVAFINAPVNMPGASPAGYDTRFKYVVIRIETSDDLTTTPTHVGSVKLTWPAGFVIGTWENGAKIQVRTAATGYNEGPAGSHWGDMSGNSANQIGTSAPTPSVPLPVKLQSFNASKEGKGVNLSWTTTDEVGSDRFDVQRSKNGKQWATIQTVNALGDSRIGKTYTALDSDPMNGENLYRLHMIDKDGSSSFSSIQNVKFEKDVLAVYPNPVSHTLTINSADFATLKSVRIVNGSGKEVYRSGSKLEDKIDVSKLSAGMYLVSLKSKSGEETSYKIVIAN